MDVALIALGFAFLGVAASWASPPTDWIKHGVVKLSRLPGNASMAVNYNPNVPLYNGSAEESARLSGSHMQNVVGRTLYLSSVTPELSPAHKLGIENLWFTGSTSVGQRPPIIPENI